MYEALSYLKLLVYEALSYLKLQARSTSISAYFANTRGSKKKFGAVEYLKIFCSTRGSSACVLNTCLGTNTPHIYFYMVEIDMLSSYIYMCIYVCIVCIYIN